MKNRLERLYKANKITEEELRNAIVKGWISEEDFNEIIGEQNETDGNEELNS